MWPSNMVANTGCKAVQTWFTSGQHHAYGSNNKRLLMLYCCLDVHCYIGCTESHGSKKQIHSKYNDIQLIIKWPWCYHLVSHMEYMPLITTLTFAKNDAGQRHTMNKQTPDRCFMFPPTLVNSVVIIRYISSTAVMPELEKCAVISPCRSTPTLTHPSPNSNLLFNAHWQPSSQPQY